MHGVFARGRATGSDLGDIECRTAADADDQIRTLGRIARSLDMGKLGLAGKAGIDRRVDPFRLERSGQLVCHARGGKEAVHDDGSAADGAERLGSSGNAIGSTGREADFGNEGSRKLHGELKNLVRVKMCADCITI